MQLQDTYTEIARREEIAREMAQAIGHSDAQVDSVNDEGIVAAIRYAARAVEAKREGDDAAYLLNAAAYDLDQRMIDGFTRRRAVAILNAASDALGVEPEAARL